MSAKFLLSDLMIDQLGRNAGAFHKFTSESVVTVVMGADLDVPTMQVLAPGVTDFTDPTRCTIVVNTGGKGALRDTDVYHTCNMELALAGLLLQLDEEDHKTIIPVNHAGFGAVLHTALQGLYPDRRILFLHSGMAQRMQTAVFADVKGFLVKEEIDIFICSPSFSTGIVTTFAFRSTSERVTPTRVANSSVLCRWVGVCMLCVFLPRPNNELG